MQINRFVEIFMKFPAPYLATQPTISLSSLIVIGLVVLEGAAPYGNLTGPLRDTYGTAGDRFGKLSRVDETMNLLHKTDMILVKLYRASAR